MSPLHPDQPYPDPLQYETDLPLNAVHYPLGFGISLTTNSPSVLAAAEKSWAQFPGLFDEPPLDIRIAVTAGAPIARTPPTIRGHDHLVTLVADSNNFAVCDYSARSGFCWASSSVVEDQAYFRWHFLEAMVYVLLTQLHLTPVHGAFVARNGTGVLLCGAAGSGKSTLSLACARAGWTFLSDDTSYLLRRSKAGQENLVLGKPLELRLREDVSHLFPELSGWDASVAPNGKRAVEVLTAELPNVAVDFRHSADALVFLERDGTEPAGLSPISEAVAIDRLATEVAFLGSEIRHVQMASLERLATKPSFTLRYGTLDAAVAALEDLTAPIPAAV